jgi:hypothetical protein
MKVEKLGRIFTSSGQRPWMGSHAQVPIAEHVEGDVYRIYFTSRDGQNRSHIVWLEIDIRNPQRILRLADAPLLGPGIAGAFDDCGAMTSWMIRASNKRFFHYIGWNIRTPVPFQNAIGLAIGDASLNPPTVERYSIGPVVDRNLVDPYFCSNPCVLLEAGIWKMWYLSGLDWESVNGRLESRYNIRYAESDDGVHWRRDGRVHVGFHHSSEVAIARPCVIKDRDRYRMWYCFRGRNFPYRIGYAESSDGQTWTRHDEQAGLERSADGWDSEMVAYPYVFDHQGKRYMLYCGNGFSKGGFGLAVFD